MFRNKWGALVFVAITLAGVINLVGTKDEKGAIQEAAASIAHQRETAERFTSGGNEVTTETSPVVVAAPSDEELIDPAIGFDPTPADTFASEEAVVPSDQVIILPPDDQPGQIQQEPRQGGQ